MSYNGGLIAAAITNGATGPDKPAEFVVQIATKASPTLVIEHYRAPANGGNDVVTYFSVPIDPNVLYVRTRFENPGDQAVTVEAEAHITTALV